MKNRRSKSRSRLNKDECAFCREKGHWKKDYPKLKSKAKPNNGKTIMDSNVADCDDSNYSLVTTYLSKSSNVWLIDLSCSYHMCPNRDKFVDLQEGECGVIHTANNNYLTAYDVGALESKGFKVIADNGVMRICSSALVVMKAIRRNNNIYHYQGSTFIGTAKTTSNDDTEAEMTRLWHMHLGHTGGKPMKTLSDQGLLKGAKTCNLEFCEHCVKGKYFTVRNTPQQNGVAERMNRTLLEKVRCMLSNAGLGKEFWAEAITYACHLLNRIPSVAIGRKTPLEKWYGKSAEDYDSLYVFGSIAYYHTRKIIFSRDVTFDESALTNKESNEETTKDFPLEEEPVEGEVSSQEPQPQLESIATSKPKRTIRKPAQLIDMVACADSIATYHISTTYKDAVQSSEEDKWRIAMDEEMYSLHQKHTWKLANLSEGMKAIGCKWVFIKKEGFPHQDVHYKARLVAKEYAQKEGIDYN
ncbi:hypothetical protein KY289_036412 [Solanum tuberosum]|nr:hypothetical protein KY289_036412 [Solanum tuberosum]